MALIIKGDMPKACWNMRNIDGKIIRYNCPYYGCCSHVFPYDVDYRPSDCPILGEIPDEHGRLGDLDAILAQEKPHGIADDVWEESQFFKVINNAPTIVEAST